MSSNELSGALSGILSDPEALSGIMKLADSLMGGEAKPAQLGKPESKASEKQEEAPLMPSLFSGGTSKESCALLSALRPFVSDSRKESIDKIIKLLRLADLAGGFLGASGKETP